MDYWGDERTTLVKADYASTLSLVEGLADLVFTSPPYDDARTYDNNVSWKFEDYQRLGDAIYTALKPGGHCLLVLDSPVRKWRKGFGSERGFTPWKVMLDWAERVGFRVPDRLAYGRHGFPGSFKGRFRNDWEPLLWFQRPGAEGYFDRWPLAEKAMYGNEIGQTVSARHKDGSTRSKGVSGKAAAEGLKHRGTYWSYGGVGHGHDLASLASNGHPARFTSRLASDVIQCFSPPDGLVCDPMVGSGTTALMARKLGRQFVGGDLFCAKDGRPWAQVAWEVVNA